MDGKMVGRALSGADRGIELGASERRAARWLFGALVALLVLCGLPGMAGAQSSGQGGFDTTHFEPAPSQHTGVLNLDRPVVLGHLVPSAGLFVHYADDPVRIVSRDRKEVRTRVVHDRLSLDAGLAIGLFDYLEVGLSLPFVARQGGENLSALGIGESAAGTTLSDLRTSVKVALLKPEQTGGVALSASGLMYAPTGNPSKFTSDGAVRGIPRLSFGWQSEDGVEVLGNLGWEFGPPVSVRNYNDEGTFRWGAGGVAPLPIDDVDFVGSLFGSHSVGDGDGSQADPIELVGAARVDLPEDFRVQFGGGAGLTDGVGAPGFRLFASLHWADLRHDTDGDGLLDRNDGCPERAEDRDGFEDPDGCPDPDNDGDEILDRDDACPEVEGIDANDGCPRQDADQDGIRDGKDECPDEPEDRDDFEDDDGCPDEDNDGDGILDENDECPDVEGIEEKDGCPAEDRDNDGIRDGEDQCPGDPEDRDGHNDEDGCPDQDNDGDGLLDEEDECPDEPETKNGRRDDDGCPDEAEAKVVEQKIELSEKIYFESDKAEIKERSYSVLEDVARVLGKHEQITKIRIVGHTDSRGSEQYNKKLSRERAQSVKSFLVDQEIDASRLEAEGRGESDPIASNETETGRAKNRRVEFVIEEVDGEPVKGDEVILEEEKTPEDAE